MKKDITKWYLKWYYGYKNFWDELLVLGVIQYLFSRYPLQKLTIEVEDIDWFWTWLRRHESYIPDVLSKVELVSNKDRFGIISKAMLRLDTHLFLGWGEVFTPARGRFHGGWNLLILFWHYFLRRQVTLLGWISKAKWRFFRLLYSFVIPRCQTIVLREKFSLQYVKELFPGANNLVLYKDFGHAFIESLSLPSIESTPYLSTKSKTCLHCPYLIINTNPHVDMSMLTQVLSTLTGIDTVSDLVYFAWDKVDTVFYAQLSTLLSTHRWTMFDWTEHDILSIIDLFRHAKGGVWVRLHVLSMFVWFGVPYSCVVYQEKISKFLDVWAEEWVWEKLK